MRYPPVEEYALKYGDYAHVHYTEDPKTGTKKGVLSTPLVPLTTSKKYVVPYPNLFHINQRFSKWLPLFKRIVNRTTYNKSYNKSALRIKFSQNQHHLIV